MSTSSAPAVSTSSPTDTAVNASVAPPPRSTTPLLFSCSAVLAAGTAIRFDLTSFPEFVASASLFESVQLDRAQVNVHLGPAAAGVVGAAFVSQSTSVSSTVGCSRYHPSSLQFAGPDSSNFSLTLPDSHAFGREMRGVSVGNKPPVVYVVAENYPASTPHAAVVNCVFWCSGSGTGAEPVVCSAPAATALATSSSRRA
jgi:hypothetical protein